MKLQQRFVMFTVGMILLNVVIGIGISHVLYMLLVKEKSDERHIRVIEQFSNQIVQAEYSLEETEEFLNSMSKIGYQFALINEMGEKKFFGEPFSDQAVTDEMHSLFADEQFYHGISDTRSVFFMQHLFSNKLENTVGVRLQFDGEQWALFMRSTNNSMFSEIHIVVMGFLISLFIVSVVGILLFSRKMIRSLGELNNATHEIAKNNFDYPLTIQRNDEIGQLADSFRMMQEKLANTDETRKKFINNVSHDFQSPLLNILGYTELLEQELGTEKAKQYNGIIKNEAKRLSNLTKQLLVLTSIDEGTYPVQKQMVRIDEQLHQVVRSMMWRIQEKELEISFDLQPVQVYGDKTLLFNAWENLISNAIKYNKIYGSIHVCCTEEDRAVLVTIEDTGIGMQTEDIPQIFERFYRVDASRNKDGMGLGLSIVYEVLQYHQADIDVRSAPNEGTTFSIRFPKDN